MREWEIAVRQAMGAPRSRLIGQLLAESLLLAALGTAIGAAFAQGFSRALIAFLSTPGNPLFVGLEMDQWGGRGDRASCRPPPVLSWKRLSP